MYQILSFSINIGRYFRICRWFQQHRWSWKKKLLWSLFLVPANTQDRKTFMECSWGLNGHLYLFLLVEKVRIVEQKLWQTWEEKWHQIGSHLKGMMMNWKYSQNKKDLVLTKSKIVSERLKVLLWGVKVEVYLAWRPIHLLHYFNYQ